MCIVQIVRGTDGDIIQRSAAALQFVDVTIETLEFGEKICFGKVSVEHADVVVFVDCCDEEISGVTDCPHMPGRYVSGCTNESKPLHAGTSTLR